MFLPKKQNLLSLAEETDPDIHFRTDTVLDKGYQVASMIRIAQPSLLSYYRFYYSINAVCMLYQAINLRVVMALGQCLFSRRHGNE